MAAHEPLPREIPTVTGATVRLRPLREADLPDIVLACRDPQTVRWTVVPDPYAESDAREYVEEASVALLAGREARWAIAAVDRDRWLGNIDVRLVRRGADGAEGEIGCLVHPAARGRGVAVSAVRLLSGYAFDTLRLPRLVWRAEVGNEASRRAAEKAGFVLEGVLRGALHARDGGWCDAWSLALLPSDDREPDLATAIPPVWLQGGSVTLRPFEVPDAPVVLAVAGDPVASASLPAPVEPCDQAAALRYVTIGAHLARWDGTGNQWAACRNSDGQVLAGVWLSGVDRRAGTARMGWWLSPAGRGGGLLPEALAVAARWAFAALPVHRLVAEPPPAPDADAQADVERALRAVGFAPGGAWQLHRSDAGGPGVAR